ncbi:MAG: hypothetical protein FD155_3464 [Bacteroidetes bacterium]|nr:MAG: hypothetical protein FD155_3464 [Bacteroidota bacterium]
MGSFKEMLAKDIQERTGMNVRPMMDMGLLSLDEARKWVVRRKYYEMAKTRMTLTDIKYELAEIYGMSVSGIEKMIYKPKKPKQLTNE